MRIPQHQYGTSANHCISSSILLDLEGFVTIELVATLPPGGTLDAEGTL
jgi:hypothetical protein